MNDLVADWQAQIRDAASRGRVLGIRGGHSKAFYGRATAEPDGWIDVRPYAGILSHEPSELVVTVRAGTLLVELQTVLAQHGQMLAFEPPYFGGEATVGGCVAAGLAGPRRMAAGSVRDFVLGVTLLDGRGTYLSFGGQVMKNVAGYDVSRLMAGSLGSLGVLLDVSLKVLPLPRAEQTLCLELGEGEALMRCAQWGGRPLPVSATLWHGGQLWVRLSGNAAAVDSAVAQLGGECLAPEQAAALWQSVREHRHEFFTAQPATPLWRLSLPSVAPPVALEGAQLIEWGGALRWLRSDVSADAVRAAVAAVGGHACLFRGGDRSGAVFHPLAPAMLTLQQRVKQAFDPFRVFNPGRIYPEI